MDDRIEWKTTNYPIARQIIFAKGEPFPSMFCRQFSVKSALEPPTRTVLVTNTAFERIKFPATRMTMTLYFGLDKDHLRQILVDMAQKAAFDKWPKSDYFSHRNRRAVLAELLQEIFGPPELPSLEDRINEF